MWRGMAIGTVLSNLAVSRDGQGWFLDSAWQFLLEMESRNAIFHIVA
jgi:hypothetical protein